MSSYHHLTIEERENIYIMRHDGLSVNSIANRIQRSSATVSRELKRNSPVYSPSKAQSRYQNSKTKCGRKAILSNARVLQIVKHLFLDFQWSPEEISARLRLENSDISISFTTIYRGIYAGFFDEPTLSHGNRGVIRRLRHRGKARHSKNFKETRGKIQITNSINERPAKANNRLEIGHWELDTVAGKTGHSCVVTMVDRKSRYTLISKANKKSSEPVTKAITKLLKALPQNKLKTITPDRGKEFSKHSQITSEFKAEFYFPNPHAPWQRGTSENTNGLIREYLPKTEDIDPLDDKYIHEFTKKLNNRPRKCLGWKTPYEIFYQEVLHLI